MFNQRTDEFNRILTRVNDADDRQLRDILAYVCKGDLWNTRILYMNVLKVKTETDIHNIDYLLDFKDSQRKQLK